MLNKTIIGGLSAFLILFGSCKNDSEVQPQQPVIQDEIASLNTADDLFQVNIKGLSPKVGYSQYEVEILNLPDESLATISELSLMPMMDMGSMMHSTFHEKLNDNNPCDYGIAFQMASTEMMTWSLDISFMADGQHYDLSVPIEVEDQAPPNIGSFMNPIDSVGMFISLVNSRDFEVGVNTLDLVLFEKLGMMNWPGKEDLIIQFEPSMPSMGHGSPNNVHPVSMVGGHYEGKVNFTMTGLWRLDFKIFDGSQKIGECAIEIEL